MTPVQLSALQSYIASVVRVMTNHAGAHSANVMLLQESKKNLERAFNAPDYPDLLPTPSKPTELPNLL